MDNEKTKEQLIAEANAFQEHQNLKINQDYNTNKSLINEANSISEETISSQSQLSNQQQQNLRLDRKEERETEEFGVEFTTTSSQESVFVREFRWPDNSLDLKNARTGIGVGFVSSDIDELFEDIDLTIQIFGQSSLIVSELESVINNTITNSKQSYKIITHMHNYHRHKSLSGHSARIGYKTDGNNGPEYDIGGPGSRVIIELLQAEMNTSVDMDDNGQCYYHDFIFNNEDVDLPLGLKLFQSSNFHVPGRPKYFMVDQKTGMIQNSPAKLYDDEYSTIFTGHKEIITYNEHHIPDTHVEFLFIKRTKPVVIWKWNQYLNSIGSKISRYHKLIKP